MIKAVLDTNVFISALFWKGAPYKILQKGLNGAFSIFISLEILKEIENKLINKFQFPIEDTNAFIEIIAINSKIVEPIKHFNIVKDDPSDNKIIDCAVAGEVDYIITGDKHLLRLKKFGKIEIMPPQEFFKIL